MIFGGVAVGASNGPATFFTLSTAGRLVVLCVPDTSMVWPVRARGSMRQQTAAMLTRH